MRDSDFYPPGAADDPDAPYNQEDYDPVDVDVDVCVSQTLHKSTTISVIDYVADMWEEYEPDDEVGFYRIGGIDYDFSDSDLKGAYEEQEYDIPKLLEYLKAYLIEDIANCDKNSGKKRKLQHILNCCEGWEVDETEVIKE